MPLKLDVNYVLQVNILLVLVLVKLAHLANTLPIPELPLVILVVVVNKLLLMQLLVIIVYLANIPMEVNVNNVPIILIPVILDLALVILAHLAIKSILIKLVVYLVILDIFLRMVNSVRNVPMELIHLLLVLSLVMAANVVEKFSTIRFVSSVYLVISLTNQALANLAKETLSPPILELALVLLALMDLKPIQITLLVSFVNPDNFPLVDHPAKTVL